MKLRLFVLLIFICAAVWGEAVTNSQQTSSKSSASKSIVRAEQTPDAVFKQRLQQLPYVVDLPYNHEVKQYIVRYMKNPKGMVELLSKQNYYMPIFQEILAKYDIPYELGFLPIIESRLNPQAVSPMGAAGLWQMIASTARKYGLVINSRVDERFDTVKATHAAAKYLQALYKIYKDWSLVIAAYNCGSGNVNKAISRAGGKRDLWSVYTYLPNETRIYMPLYIAAVYSMNFADCHMTLPKSAIYSGHNAPADSILFPDLTAALDEKAPVDTIVANERVHLDQVSDSVSISQDLLRQLNPQYAHDILPSANAYTLSLPIDQQGNFIMNQAKTFAHRADELMNERLEKSEKDSTDDSNNGVTYYTVQEGDNLSTVAAKFNVSVKQIKAWNGLSLDFLNVGEKLKIIRK
jgi:membrane-bound lytic murein transglycosylase D